MGRTWRWAAACLLAPAVLGGCAFRGPSPIVAPPSADFLARQARADFVRAANDVCKIFHRTADTVPQPSQPADSESAWDPRRLLPLEVRMEHGSTPGTEEVPA